MRTFDFEKTYRSLLDPEIVTLLGQIHEYKGEQTLYIETKPETLIKLMEIARIQSTDASNRIEGISTSDVRLKKLVEEKTEPQSRNEEEIAGYRDVLATIHQGYEYIPPKPTFLLQLHRDLYKFSGVSKGGTYKSSDNVIEETRADGQKYVRFVPVSAWETPETMTRLCAAFEDSSKNPELDPLLLIAIFILDFLCIHPFHDGNGRISRLLTLLLFYRAGYIVGKYISIEKIIEQSKETYYEVLLESSQAWRKEQNDYLPFVKYFLGVLLAAYRDFASRVNLLTTKNLSKPDRIRELIKNNLGKITKAEILERLPDISQVTVQRTLKELTDSGEIIKIGGGRYTEYALNSENE